MQQVYEERSSRGFTVVAVNVQEGPRPVADFVDRYGLSFPVLLDTNGDPFADINPDSETVLEGCLVEPALAEVPVGDTVQFERLGYFCPDPDSRRERLVFNRTLGLKDSWAKIEKGQGT